MVGRSEIVWIRIYHRACPFATGTASHISITECPAVCQVYGWAMSDPRTCHPPNVCKQQSLGKGIRQDHLAELLACFRGHKKNMQHAGKWLSDLKRVSRGTESHGDDRTKLLNNEDEKREHGPVKPFKPLLSTTAYCSSSTEKRMQW
ncbi:hypothetical protein Vadar_028872 [Vaccinium darrowii]|uniref:Uncharacterized protein n=1 Tax=Vaccinium darrowii TaxID=229202 RepID=A0ACB7XUN1_9ERIC|nr:hypothetical protein Vadar_028872 [Vaccinium darrowii]